MPIIKILTLAIILTFVLITPSYAQDDSALANALVEFEVDEIDAKDLNIEEPNSLPGEFKYNWQIFKENIGLFFTFKPEEKITKLEEISNRRLIEAQKLAATGTTNAANRVEEALKRYEQTREKIATRLEENPELKERLLEKFDANQLKHQQILSTVAEKLRNRASQADLEKLEKIKKEVAVRWYNANKEKTQERLEEAIDDNNVGSKFRQLRNIATLEELSETLPEEASDKIEAAKLRAEERLAEKLNNVSLEDRDKIEKYIKNIKTTDLIKQKFINNLKDSSNIPDSIRERMQNMSEQYIEILINRFESLSPEEQERFLQQFNADEHPAYLQLLERIKNANNANTVDDLIETQKDGIKARIQATTDPARLRILEQNVSADPVLRRQIQDRKIQINSNPSLTPQ